MDEGRSFYDTLHFNDGNILECDLNNVLSVFRIRKEIPASSNYSQTTLTAKNRQNGCHFCSPEVQHQKVPLRDAGEGHCMYFNKRTKQCENCYMKFSHVKLKFSRS